MSAIASSAGSVATAPPAGVIGPNALIRVGEALTERHGAATAARLFDEARLGPCLAAPPTVMVDEREVGALHAVLRARLGVAEARAVGHRAGVLTADYLLAHRIPPMAGRVLRLLPAQPSARLLLGAIGGHAWTFAGSGTFSWRAGRPVHLSITDCPLCRGARTTADAPLCDYYAGTFERLFGVLVHPQASVVQTQCQAAGAAACRFLITW